MDNEILVKKVQQRVAATTRFVSSALLKADLSADGVPWGPAHGWRIRDAEDQEFMREEPRLVKWRIRPGVRGMIGYSLAGDDIAEALAEQLGYQRLRG